MAKRAKAPKPPRRGPEPGQSPVFHGDRLRALRQSKGWTLAEMGYRSAVSPQQINSFEAGRADPSMRVFVKLVRALEVDARYLLGLDDS